MDYIHWSDQELKHNPSNLILCQFSDKVAPESMYFGKLKARLKVLTEPLTKQKETRS